MAAVLGVDVWQGRWVGVVISDGVVSVDVDASLAWLVARFEPEVVGVDTPIGLPITGRRRADEMVRAFVGPRRSSVFHAPPADVMPMPSYSEALAHCRRRHGFGISAQAYALRSAVMEAAELAEGDSRVYEVHPEASFRAMAGEPLAFPKRSWNGQVHRRRLLVEAGVVVPDDVGEWAVPADDVLDAAAAAWTARRIATGVAESFPDPPERIADREVAIWC